MERGSQKWSGARIGVRELIIKYEGFRIKAKKLPFSIFFYKRHPHIGGGLLYTYNRNRFYSTALQNLRHI